MPVPIATSVTVIRESESAVTTPVPINRLPFLSVVLQAHSPPALTLNSCVLLGVISAVCAVSVDRRVISYLSDSSTMLVSNGV